jgi:hypothetical protein
LGLTKPLTGIADMIFIASLCANVFIRISL